MVRAGDIPQYVELSTALNERYYIKLMTQVSALKTACSSVVNAPLSKIRVMIGGTDAYKLITNTYNDVTDTGFDIHIEVDDELEPKVSQFHEQIIQSSYRINPSLQTMFVNFGRPQAHSNGQFKIDTESGRVFHPFPKTSIDSTVFIHEHTIITPSLEKMIQEANDSVAFEQLASLFKSYFIWQCAGKRLSPETAHTFVSFCKDSSENAIGLKNNIAQYQQLPPGYTSLTFMNAILMHPTNEGALVRHATKPLETKLENLSAEHAATQAELKETQEKAKFADMILNLATQKLAGITTENIALKDENTKRAQEIMDLENSLQETQDALTTQAQQFKEKETDHQTAERTAASRITELEAKLANANKAIEQEKSKNTQHITENAALIKKAEILSQDLQQQATAHQAELSEQRAKVSSLQSGLATVSRKNKTLEQTIARLKNPAQKIATVITPRLEETISEPGETHAQQVTTANTSPVKPETVQITDEAIKSEPVKTALGEKIKQFVWYAIKMFTTEKMQSPSEKVLEKNYTNLTQKDHESINQCIRYSDVHMASEEEAIVCANYFYVLYPKIKSPMPDDKLKSSMEMIILELDSLMDTALCSKNIFENSQRRISEYYTLFTVMLRFLEHTNTNPHAVRTLKYFIALSQSTQQEDVAWREMLISKLEAAGNIHHFLVRNTKTIKAGAKLFKKSLANPNSETSPELMNALPEAVTFHREFQTLRTTLIEYDMGQARYFNTAKHLPEDQRPNISQTEFHHLMFLFSQLYRFKMSELACFPWIEEYHTKKNASETYFNMINALKSEMPRLASKEIIEYYLYGILRWSEYHPKQKIGLDSPLIGLVSRLISIDFVNKLKTSAPASRKSMIESEIPLALEDIHHDIILSIPESQRLDYLSCVVDMVASWPMLEIDLNIYAQIHATLKNKIAIGMLKKQLALSCIKAIQYMQHVEIKALKGTLSYGFNVSPEEIQKLPSIQAAALVEISKHLPEFSSIAQAKSFLHVFCEYIFLIPYIRDNQSKGMLEVLTDALNHLDNSKALFQHAGSYDDPAVKRFVNMFNQYKLINSILQDKNLQKFEDTSALIQTSQQMVDALLDVDNRKTLLLALIDVGDKERASLKNSLYLVSYPDLNEIISSPTQTKPKMK